ncbi:unnamed protein product [Prunus armeniaca]
MVCSNEVTELMVSFEGLLTELMMWIGGGDASHQDLGCMLMQHEKREAYASGRLKWTQKVVEFNFVLIEVEGERRRDKVAKFVNIWRFITWKWMIGFVVPTYDVIGKAQFINWRSDNDVAAGVARDLLTPRDLRTLGKKDESIAVDDAMSISIQCASSVANLGQRLLAKNQEVRELTLQLGNLRVALRECHTLIKDHNELKNEHDQATLEGMLWIVKGMLKKPLG